MASLVGATPAAAQIAVLPSGALARSLFPDVLGAFSMSMVVALAVFAATTAILHVRERGRWIRREAQLAADLDSAMARAARREARETAWHTMQLLVLLRKFSECFVLCSNPS